MNNVKRVRFVDMVRGTGDRWIAIGGVRFYSSGVLIESGELISESGTVAQMKNLTARTSSKYHNHYMIHHATLTTRNQVGNYPNNGYWLAADSDLNGWYEVEFNEPKTIDMMEWVQRPDTSYGQRGTKNPIKVQFYDENNNLIEEQSVDGDRNTNAVSSLDLRRALVKWLVESSGASKFWSGSTWVEI